ncbi:hypothetical protein DL93DRAFT_2077736 [Clavulina sp. PMI_390]|nr:hypothetical protein DL93DRAFT_2077736 [Clavulina sp. PMI_390]
MKSTFTLLGLAMAGLAAASGTHHHVRANLTPKDTTSTGDATQLPTFTASSSCPVDDVTSYAIANGVYAIVSEADWDSFDSSATNNTNCGSTILLSPTSDPTSQDAWIIIVDKCAAQDCPGTSVQLGPVAWTTIAPANVTSFNATWSRY